MEHYNYYFFYLFIIGTVFSAVSEFFAGADFHQVMIMFGVWLILAEVRRINNK